MNIDDWSLEDIDKEICKVHSQINELSIEFCKKNEITFDDWFLFRFSTHMFDGLPMSFQLWDLIFKQVRLFKRRFIWH